jgi:ribosomal protein L37AE/L43A
MRCRLCGEAFDVRRADIGHDTCMDCGEWEAKKTRHCVVPMNKSNYVVVSDVSLLRQLNPKRVGG